MSDKPLEENALVQDLVLALKNKCAEVRRVAAWVIGERGINVSETTVALVAALRDQVLPVRVAAGRALSKLGCEAEATVPVLAKALEEADGADRRVAIEALVQFGPPFAQIIVPTLIVQIGDNLMTGRTDIIEALGEFGPAAKQAVSFLATIVGKAEEEHQELRRPAVQALGKIGSEAKEAAPVLARALRTPDVGVCLSALIALEEIGATPEAVPELIATFDFRDPGTGEFRNRYPGMLMMPGGDVHQTAAKLLGDLGADARKAVPALERLTQTPTKEEMKELEKKEAEEDEEKIKGLGGRRWAHRRIAESQIEAAAEVRKRNRRTTSEGARKTAAASLEKIRQALSSAQA